MPPKLPVSDEPPVASEAPAPSMQRLELQQRIRGVYALTPGWHDTDRLVQSVQALLDEGVRLVQYRAKDLPAQLCAQQAQRLRTACERSDALLILNDDWKQAGELPQPAVHIGRDDGDPAQVRSALGDRALIGLSCYADLERAREHYESVDYLAFGSVFQSSSKPTAPTGALEEIPKARQFGRPVVAIGGITAKNAELARLAGADAIAVIAALFGAEGEERSAADVAKACRELAAAFGGV